MPERQWASIEYEPTDGASLFDLWEVGEEALLPAPIAVRDPAYRHRIVESFGALSVPDRRMLSVGAGNGFVERELQFAGWDVTATDKAEGALKHCRAKGLRTARLDLLSDENKLGRFGAIYCDGLMGHLWDPLGRCIEAWNALARFGSAGTVCVTSNDLSDEDGEPQFGVSSSPTASFYRPAKDWFAQDALATDRWEVVSSSVYCYRRKGRSRRREILVVRLLVDEGIETKHRSELRAG